MLTVETIADIAEDGTLTAKTPGLATKGRRRVVIVIDDESPAPPLASSLPDLSEFRGRLQGKPYPGNSVVDYRAEERS